MNESKLYKSIICKNDDDVRKNLCNDLPKPIKALTYVRLSQYKRAQEIISEFESENPGQRNQYILETKLLLAKKYGDFKEALLIAQELNQFASDSFFGNYVLSEMFRKIKQWNSSYACICKCLDILPNHENLNIEAAALQIKMKNPSKAIYHLNLVKNNIRKIIHISN